ncbi:MULTISPECIES: pentapeptide repeat-containing protein [unclassified Leptolyngbya]|uniref:pentapeptide repeat-containing protein n=1 Tax=unclassified Leptolyngbya TaxID=2650499 RepID=UPI001689B03E|nr:MULTISPECIES: pentapeptide repeat-containing protein [unclassified Leptolyngbya]MBD1911686.1 pentapeptide repeat-containing protein [Leptolyngbya sp. FACHB-8]MBD2155521.1 pentapeptide repeat-containing protein [Leptolyngbya sp. FACHB-16]
MTDSPVRSPQSIAPTVSTSSSALPPREQPTLIYKLSATDFLREYENGKKTFTRLLVKDGKFFVQAPTLSGGNLQGAWLWEIGLSRALLKRVNFSDAKLYRADLSGADMTEANLWKADLRKANLIRTNLSGAFLGGASLQEARLNGANLSRADLRGADLTNADLSGAILDQTIMPDGTIHN